MIYDSKIHGIYDSLGVLRALLFLEFDHVRFAISNLQTMAVCIILWRIEKRASPLKELLDMLQEDFTELSNGNRKHFVA